MSLHRTRERKPSKGGTLAAPESRITIGEIARAFNVSLRTLRFYEDKGLIVPRREGTTRFYTPADKVKLELIMQGKQLGFTLVEIREMLGQSDQNLKIGRLALQPDQISAQLAHLERQRSDIDGAILELKLAQMMMQQSH